MIHIRAGQDNQQRRENTGSNWTRQDRKQTIKIKQEAEHKQGNARQKNTPLNTHRPQYTKQDTSTQQGTEIYRMNIQTQETYRNQ